MQLRDDYVEGQLIRSRWFRPNGTLIQQTDWDHGTGEGLYCVKTALFASACITSMVSLMARPSNTMKRAM